MHANPPSLLVSIPHPRLGLISCVQFDFNSYFVPYHTGCFYSQRPVSCRRCGHCKFMLSDFSDASSIRSSRKTRIGTNERVAWGTLMLADFCVLPPISRSGWSLSLRQQSSPRSSIRDGETPSRHSRFSCRCPCLPTVWDLTA